MTSEEKMNPQVSSRKESKALKAGIILGTSLLLLIPIGFMAGIIHSRSSYRDEAVKKVAQSWADRQAISVPHLSFNTQNDKNEKVTRELKLNNYEATVRIRTEMRKKGIFKVPVYIAEVTQKGDFVNSYGNLSGKQVTLGINISDTRGFVTEPIFTVNNSTPQKNQDVAYSTLLKTSASHIPFEITYQIKGLNAVEVDLGGRSNKIAIQGNWNAPEFKGDFLPSEREVTSEEFKAKWSVPQIALSQGRKVAPSVEVSLLVPVDSYSMASRSLKYGLLLVIFTFAGYFLFELTSKNPHKIHPIQYGLLGGAILMFYLLLVSISEILTFNVAYLISALMIMGLVGTYTYFVITKKQNRGFSVGITAVIGGLYAFFWILLRLEEVALLAGSLGLFAMLAAFMYLTRNVNWYNEA